MLNIQSSNRKGIYKDLYRTLEIQKKEEHKKNEAFSARVPKGIYKDIYKGIEEAKGSSKRNIWHEYPLKALVYSNDVGESLRPLIGGLMAKLSWIPAIFYMLFALLSGNKKEGLAQEITFQAAASFIFPFMLIKSSRAAANKAIEKVPSEVKDKIISKISKIKLFRTIESKFKKNNIGGFKNLILSAAGISSVLIGAKPIDRMVKRVIEPHFAKEI